MLGDYVFHRNVSPGNGSSTHKGSGLDLIRNDRISGAMELSDAFNTDHIRTCAFDIGSHTVQKVGHVYHMGLLGHVFQDRLSLRHGRRHHNINSSTNRNHIQINVAGYQVDGMGNHRSANDGHIRTKGAKSLQMLVDGPASDGTASGQRHLCTFILTKKRTDKIIRCADFSHMLIFHSNAVNRAGIDLYRMTIESLHPRSQINNGLQQRIDITHIRQIFNDNILIRHN